MVEGKGWTLMKKRWTRLDVAALFLAVLTFGVIVAIVVQNFLNVW